MNTNLETINFPFRCISYYASSKSKIDNKNSYEFWLRGKCIRIICNKPFSRGDVLEIKSIKNTSNGIMIDSEIIDEWEQEYPVLNFISGRLVYNKWVNFECVPSEGIQILNKIEQILSDSYSIGFIILAYKTGKITCNDTVTGNAFDIYINLNWE